MTARPTTSLRSPKSSRFLGRFVMALGILCASASLPVGPLIGRADAAGSFTVSGTARGLNGRVLVASDDHPGSCAHR